MAVTSSVHDALKRVFGTTGPLGAAYYTAGASVGVAFGLWEAYLTFVYSLPVFGQVAKSVLGPKENYYYGGKAVESQADVEEAPLVSTRQPPSSVSAQTPAAPTQPETPDAPILPIKTAPPTEAASPAALPAEAPDSPLPPVATEERVITTESPAAPHVELTADDVPPSAPIVPVTPESTDARAAEKLGNGKAGVVHVTAVTDQLPLGEKPEEEIAESSSQAGSEMTASSYMTANTVDTSTGEVVPKKIKKAKKSLMEKLENKLSFNKRKNGSKSVPR